MFLNPLNNLLNIKNRYLFFPPKLEDYCRWTPKQQVILLNIVIYFHQYRSHTDNNFKRHSIMIFLTESALQKKAMIKPDSQKIKSGSRFGNHSSRNALCGVR